jgi:hypothetical protein
MKDENQNIMHLENVALAAGCCLDSKLKTHRPQLNSSLDRQWSFAQATQPQALVLLGVFPNQ